MNDSEIARESAVAAELFKTDPARADLLFTDLLRRHPRDGMIYLQRASAREKAGMRPEAREDFAKAAQLLKYPGWKEKAQAGIRRTSTEAASTVGRDSSDFYVPTSEEFGQAERIFREREPRAIVYDAVLVILEQAFEDPTRLSPVIGVGALLQSWNFAYYQPGTRNCDGGHLLELDLAIGNLMPDIIAFRPRDISSFEPSRDAGSIGRLFNTLEGPLGRVGAAKALHILAPRFFPLWDNPIAIGYGVTLGPVGSNAGTYVRFVEQVKVQASRCRVVIPHRLDVLKAIDEYNYCKFSKKWL